VSYLHLDRGCLRFWATYLKLCFCDSEGATSDSKTWRRVTEPWKSDSFANAVTLLRSKDHSIEVLDVTRLRDARTAPTGAVSLAGAYKQRPVIAMLCRQVDTGRGSLLPTFFDLEHVISSYRNAILMSGLPIPDHGFTIQRQTAFRRLGGNVVDVETGPTGFGMGSVVMARQPKKQRNEQQRIRQAELRARKREERRADRDDMARALLWIMIREAQREKDPRKALDLLRNTVIDELEKQGFQVKYAEDDFEALAAKYASSVYPFRIKRHLQTDADPDGDPTSGSLS
jgi:hypothetical protein